MYPTYNTQCLAHEYPVPASDGRENMCPTWAWKRKIKGIAAHTPTFAKRTPVFTKRTFRNARLGNVWADNPDWLRCTE